MKRVELSSSEKIPLWFVRLYLKAKGWQMAHDFRVWNGDYEEEMFPKHPIRWLWKRIEEKTPTVRFSVAHSWDRQVGRDTGDFELWCRTIDWEWNYDKQTWKIIGIEYLANGVEVVGPARVSPRVGYAIPRVLKLT